MEPTDVDCVLLFTRGTIRQLQEEISRYEAHREPPGEAAPVAPSLTSP